MELHGVQQLIAHSTFLGYAAALSDGEASYLLWIIGATTLIAWAVGLRAGAWNRKWYRIFQGAALLALPALLLVGMVASMMPPA
jgi:hypothetical protein